MPGFTPASRARNGELWPRPFSPPLARSSGFAVPCTASPLRPERETASYGLGPVLEAFEGDGLSGARQAHAGGALAHLAHPGHVDGVLGHRARRRRHARAQLVVLAPGGGE